MPNKKFVSKENLEIFKDELDSSFASKSEVEEKQDALEFNPTVPSGTTPTALTGLKVGSDYYSVSGGSSSPVAYEGTSLLPTDVVFEDWTLHRAIKEGNILWINCAGRIKNNATTDATIKQLFNIVLPSNISSNIYRQEGTTCNDNCFMYERVLSSTGTWNSNSVVYNLLSQYANNILLELQDSIQLSAGTYMYVNVRIPIFLYIGTVQTVSNN